MSAVVFGGFAGSTATSATVGRFPVGSTPVGSTPVGSTPVGSTPVGSTTVAMSARVRRAVPADVAAMVELLDGFAAQGLVLPRSADQVIRHYREFVIAEDAHGIVGCSGLRVYSPELGEVCALGVAARSQGTGVGRRMVEALLAEARMLRLRRVFAMTLQERFFGRLGFVPVPLDSIPEKVAADRAEGIDRLVCPKLAMVRELGD